MTISTFSYSDRSGHHGRQMTDTDFNAVLARVRSENPLPGIVGKSVKLIRAGNELKGCCPFHADRSPSFTIFAGGERFHCFGCGANGDVLDYVMRAEGVTLMEALGLLNAGMIPIVAAPVVQKGDDDDRSAEALAIWKAAEPATGTPAETYLRTRGLHLPIPPSIRFARLRYGKRGEVFPTLIAAVSSMSGRIEGIQRTYLNRAGTGKAPVPKPKLSLGRVAGGAIRLADIAPMLVVAEGLEDGLTLSQEVGRPVWVAAGASMLPSMLFPAAVRSIAIGGDNDEAGRSAAQKAADAFRSRGLETRTFFPVTAKDFNAELMESRK